MDSTHILEQGIFSKCEKCKKTVQGTEVACSACGFPQHGTKDQKRSYFQRLKANRQKLNGAKNQIYLIVAILLIIGGYQIFSGFVLAVFTGQIVMGPILIISGSILAGLAYWSLKKPVSAIITGLCFHVLGILIIAIQDPSKLLEISFSTIISYIFIILMINGLFAAKRIQKIEMELKGV